MDKEIKIKVSELDEIGKEFSKADKMLLAEAMTDISNFAKYDVIHKQLDKALQLFESFYIKSNKT